MQRKGTSTRKPPEPSDSHAEIDDWMKRIVPDLQPIAARLDALFRAAVPNLHYAIKWKKAYYGMHDRGWVIEMVAYDVSLNVACSECGDNYDVETDAFGDGCMKYYFPLMAERVLGSEGDE